MTPDRPMDPDNFQKAWHSQSSQTRVTIAADLLRKEVQRSERNFRATIFHRDFREVAVGLIMLPFWFYLGPQGFAALDLVAGNSGDHLGDPVHRGRSIPSPAAAERAGRAARRQREGFARRKWSIKSGCCETCSGGICCRSRSPSWPSSCKPPGCATQDSGRSFRPRAARVVFVRALRVRLLAQPARRAHRPRAPARRAAHPARNSWR